MRPSKYSSSYHWRIQGARWAMPPKSSEFFVLDKTDSRTDRPTPLVVMMRKGVQLCLLIPWSGALPMDPAGGSAPRPTLQVRCLRSPCAPNSGSGSANASYPQRDGKYKWVVAYRMRAVEWRLSRPTAHIDVKYVFKFFYFFTKNAF